MEVARVDGDELDDALLVLEADVKLFATLRDIKPLVDDEAGLE